MLKIVWWLFQRMLKTLNKLFEIALSVKGIELIIELIIDNKIDNQYQLIQ